MLTQFNSASLNRHISQTYRMDLFSQGFVEILAAEQTPDNPNWFQGTADAVRQAARHFSRYDADYYLILAGDHLYRMDYSELIDAHIDRQRRHHDRRAAGDARATRRDGHLPVRSRRARSSAFEEKPNARAARRDRPEHPARARRSAAHAADKPFVASMGIYVFSRDVLLDMLEQDERERLRPRRSSRPRSDATTSTRTCFAATGPTSAPSTRSTRRTSC